MTREGCSFGARSDPHSRPRPRHILSDTDVRPRYTLTNRLTAFVWSLWSARSPVDVVRVVVDGGVDPEELV
jgi:hypothetical protein